MSAASIAKAEATVAPSPDPAFRSSRHVSVRSGGALFDPMLRAEIRDARAEGFDEGRRIGIEIGRSEAEAKLNGFVSEAVEEETARAHFATIRALENDHKRHLSDAVEIARRNAMNEGGLERVALLLKIDRLEKQLAEEINAAHAPKLGN